MKKLFTNRRNLIISISVLGLVLICISLVFTFVLQDRVAYTATTDPVIVIERGYHPANHLQFDASRKLYVSDGVLYFYTHDLTRRYNSQYVEELCAFKDSTVVSCGDVNSILAVNNGYVYYYEKPILSLFTSEVEIMCLNLENMTTNTLGKITNTYYDKYYGKDGTFYMEETENPGCCVALKDGELYYPIEMQELYPLGEMTYTVETDGVVRYDPTGSREIVHQSGVSLRLIPCENGLLIYKLTTGNALYYIPEESQEVIELFCHTGNAYTAVNVHNEYVYISYDRLANLSSWGIGYERAEGETVFGTYRISLEDYSVERLSEVIYDGLYIFDDTGIFATKDGCIYKLDFDGNVIMTLME